MTAVIGRAGQRAAVRPMTVTLVVVLNMLMVVLDTTIVHIAIGTLAREFHATMTDIQWVTTGYVLGLVTIIPITAWAVGRFGTKRLYSPQSSCSCSARSCARAHGMCGRWWSFV